MHRTQNSTVAIEDPGEEPDDGDGNAQSSNTAANSRNNNITPSNSPPLPPSYPCEEVCSRCGKKVSDVVLNNDQPELTEPPSDCPCECHLQTQAQSAKLMTPPAHIPPGGPNCLPGCGYFGLPCYNCSSLQNHLQPQINLQAPEHTTQPVGERFPTHIYTVELMNPDMSNGRQSQDDLCQHQQIILQSEDSPEARRKRRTCISLLVFIITINVAIAIFRMLSS